MRAEEPDHPNSIWLRIARKPGKGGEKFFHFHKCSDEGKCQGQDFSLCERGELAVKAFREMPVNARCDLRYPLELAGRRRNSSRLHGGGLLEDLKSFAGSQYLASSCKTLLSLLRDLLEVHG